MYAHVSNKTRDLHEQMLWLTCRGCGAILCPWRSFAERAGEKGHYNNRKAAMVLGTVESRYGGHGGFLFRLGPNIGGSV